MVRTVLSGTVLEVLVRDHHVLVRRVLVAADGVPAIDDLLVRGAEDLHLDPRQVVLVEHVEADRLAGLGRRVELHRDGHEAELDGPFPHRARHDRPRWRIAGAIRERDYSARSQRTCTADGMGNGLLRALRGRGSAEANLRPHRSQLRLGLRDAGQGSSRACRQGLQTRPWPCCRWTSAASSGCGSSSSCSRMPGQRRPGWRRRRPRPRARGGSPGRAGVPAGAPPRGRPAPGHPGSTTQ